MPASLPTHLSAAPGPAILLPRGFFAPDDSSAPYGFKWLAESPKSPIRLLKSVRGGGREGVGLGAPEVVDADYAEFTAGAMGTGTGAFARTTGTPAGGRRAVEPEDLPPPMPRHAPGTGMELPAYEEDDPQLARRAADAQRLDRVKQHYAADLEAFELLVKQQEEERERVERDARTREAMERGQRNGRDGEGKRWWKVGVRA